MDAGFMAAFAAVFDELLAEPPSAAAHVPQRDPGIGKEFTASFQVIIPTAPEGFSNARISATQVCSYAPGEGETIDRREAVVSRELESLRNALLAEGERLRQALSTGAYAVSRPVGAAPGRRSR